jgi:hypothetical protein
MAKYTCRICDRRFGSLTLWDVHLGSDAELPRGANARLRGEPSQEGHRDPKGGRLIDGVWRLPSSDFVTHSDAGGLLAGL